MAKLSLEQGRKLVQAARKALQACIKGENYSLEGFPDKRGVFVSLHSFPSHDLRGCIGLPHPQKPLNTAVLEAAVSAGFHDPRFPPLDKDELGKVLVEVSVLTEPKLVEAEDPKEYLDKIKIGRDGLIIQAGISSGLLLPQVPVEFGWTVEEFLQNLCLKAGLHEDDWMEVGVRIYSFQAQVFSEEEPGGEVKEKV